MKYCVLISLTSLIILFSFGFANADSAKIVDLKPSYDDHFLKISFRLEDCFSEEIDKAIKSGIPTTFTFIAKINRYNPVFFNEPIELHQWKHTIEYDNLKDEYFVLWHEQISSPFYIKDFSEAKKKQALIVNYPLAPISLLDRESRFVVEVKAMMEQLKIPYNLQKLLIFTVLWNFETAWRKIEVELP